MAVLVKKNLLKGVKCVHIKKCSDCLAGKQHRFAFKSQPPHKKPEVLNLVHSDVCKISVRPIGGAKYFVTFIDDFSKKKFGCLEDQRSSTKCIQAIPSLS
jgi:hypothetical protein